MTKTFFLLLIPAFLLAACGKKEEAPQTQQLSQPPVQQNQQQVTQPPKDTQQVAQQKQTEESKQVDKKKETKTDEKKKDDMKKVSENTEKNVTKDDGQSSDIDFATIFAKKCAKCHGKDGRGKSENAPDFTSAKFKQKSDKELYKAITGGIKSDDPDGDDMPSWKGKLTEAEIQAAIKFVKSF